jgi:hypothetical protein
MLFTKLLIFLCLKGSPDAVVMLLPCDHEVIG